MVNRKDPVSLDMFNKLVEGSNLDNLLELRNVCIFILAFAGFFGIEEVLHIKYKDIAFHDGYMTINIDVSKSDQLRKGNQVVISGSVNSTNSCPVSRSLFVQATTFSSRVVSLRFTGSVED